MYVLLFNHSPRPLASGCKVKAAGEVLTSAFSGTTGWLNVTTTAEEGSTSAAPAFGRRSTVRK